jgi:hypothetical protein
VRYQRPEKALVSALSEMCVQGASTRRVKAVTEELSGHAFSARTISQINKGLDGALARFANRPLEEAYPCLILDAPCEKVCRPWWPTTPCANARSASRTKAGTEARCCTTSAAQRPSRSSCSGQRTSA